MAPAARSGLWAPQLPDVRVELTNPRTPHAPPNSGRAPILAGVCLLPSLARPVMVRASRRPARSACPAPCRWQRQIRGYGGPNGVLQAGISETQSPITLDRSGYASFG